jgi:hypothetical protein
MSPLWAIAPGVVAVGGVMALVGLRRIAATADEVAVELDRLRDVHGALDEIRAATDDTIESAQRVRSRPAPWDR